MKIVLNLDALRVESFETLPELRKEEERMVVGGSSTPETGDAIVIAADSPPTETGGCINAWTGFCLG
ncbi:MAG: hypothetical protein AAFX50_17645 [Acidobacteriota bacterium]